MVVLVHRQVATDRNGTIEGSRGASWHYRTAQIFATGAVALLLFWPSHNIFLFVAIACMQSALEVTYTYSRTPL